MNDNRDAFIHIERVLVDAVAAFKDGSEDNAAMVDLALQDLANFDAAPVRVTTREGQVESADVDLTAFLAASVSLLHLTVDMAADASGRDRAEIIEELRTVIR